MAVVVGWTGCIAAPEHETASHRLFEDGYGVEIPVPFVVEVRPAGFDLASERVSFEPTAEVLYEGVPWIIDADATVALRVEPALVGVTPSEATAGAGPAAIPFVVGWGALEVTAWATGATIVVWGIGMEVNGGHLSKAIEALRRNMPNLTFARQVELNKVKAITMAEEATLRARYCAGGSSGSAELSRAATTVACQAEQGVITMEPNFFYFEGQVLDPYLRIVNLTTQPLAFVGPTGPLGIPVPPMSAIVAPVPLPPIGAPLVFRSPNAANGITIAFGRAPWNGR